jgi:hypothetical protein
VSGGSEEEEQAVMRDGVKLKQLFVEQARRAVEVWSLYFFRSLRFWPLENGFMCACVRACVRACGPCLRANFSSAPRVESRSHMHDSLLFIPSLVFSVLFSFFRRMVLKPSFSHARSPLTFMPSFRRVYVCPSLIHCWPRS